MNDHNDLWELALFTLSRQDILLNWAIVINTLDIQLFIYYFYKRQSNQDWFHLQLPVIGGFFINAPAIFIKDLI